MGLVGNGSPSPDPITAYRLDEAVWIFGKYVEGEIEKATEKAKTNAEADRMAQARMEMIFREDILDAQLLESDKPQEMAPGRFADPAAMITKK